MEIFVIYGIGVILSLRYGIIVMRKENGELDKKLKATVLGLSLFSWLGLFSMFVAHVFRDVH